MTTVVSHSAALVPAWSGSLGPSETLRHLLPFFSGFACLVKKVHCPNALRIDAMTPSAEANNWSVEQVLHNNLLTLSMEEVGK